MTEDPEGLWAEKANETAVKMSHEILRTLIIIHGGATIAMLSFIGNALGNGKLASNGAKILAGPLMSFGWGIVITIGAMAAAYFNDGFVVKHSFQQQKLKYDPHNTEEQKILNFIIYTKLFVHILAVAFTFTSVAAFIYGMYGLESAMSEAFPQPSKQTIL